MYDPCRKQGVSWAAECPFSLELRVHNLCCSFSLTHRWLFVPICPSWSPSIVDRPWSSVYYSSTSRL